MKRQLKNNNGFTLMELVVGVVLTAIIGTVTVAIVFNQSDTFNQLFNQTAATMDSRKALRLLRSDIQNMSKANLNTIKAAEFRFTNNDGKDIHYIAEAGVLNRNEKLIVAGVQEAPFSYLNNEGKETAVIDSVVFIGVRLNINRGDEHIVMEERIYARN